MLGIREFFFSLDHVIYNFAAQIYDFMIVLAKLDLFNNLTTAQDIINRLYIVVGVIMFFRLLLSLVQAVVDPDKAGDKKGGTGAIVTRA
ncbi:MAG: hypothetical protein GX861_01995, partial [Tenericutes bacterium]|nr:hypothetical protein [Mycoplasmatota bacterium]